MNWTSGTCNSGPFKARHAEGDEDGGSASLKKKNLRSERNRRADEDRKETGQA